MFKEIKFLHINKMYPPEIGGVETVCAQYVRISAPLGKTMVFTTSGKFGLGWRQEQDGDVTIVRFHHQIVILQLRLSLTMMLALMFARFGNMTIHIHEPYPIASLVFGLMPYKKLIVTWHSDLHRHRFLAGALGWFQRRSLNSAKAITVTSPMLAKSSSQIRAVKDKDKIHIIPLFLETTPIQIAKKSNLSKISGFDDFIHANPKYALFLGRLSYYKGINVLIDAINLLSKQGVHPPIIIAGSGEEKHRLNSIAHKSNIFIIRSHLEENEKNWLLSHSEVFLFPSTIASEAFGITQLEALSLGTPVINTSLPTAVPWVSRDKETGLTIEPNDPKALADAILSFFDGRNNKMDFSKKCRAREAKLFGKKEQMRKLQRLYETI